MNVYLNMRFVFMFNVLTLCCFSVYGRGGHGGGGGHGSSSGGGGGGGYGSSSGGGGGGGYGSSSGTGGSGHSSSGGKLGSSSSSNADRHGSHSSSNVGGQGNTGNMGGRYGSGSSNGLSSYIGIGGIAYGSASKTSSNNRYGSSGYGSSSRSDESHSYNSRYDNKAYKYTTRPSLIYPPDNRPLHPFGHYQKFEMPKTSRPIIVDRDTRWTTALAKCYHEASEYIKNINIVDLARENVTPFSIERCRNRYRRSVLNEPSPVIGENNNAFTGQTVQDSFPTIPSSAAFR